MPCSFIAGNSARFGIAGGSGGLLPDGDTGDAEIELLDSAEAATEELLAPIELGPTGPVIDGSSLRVSSLALGCVDMASVGPAAGSGLTCFAFTARGSRSWRE